MSKRFMLERFLGLTDEEIKQNEEMWLEERDDVDMQTNAGQDLRSVGITPSALESDIETGEAMADMGPNGVGSAAVGAMPPGAPTAAPPAPPA
jgi:hypothetical protein